MDRAGSVPVVSTGVCVMIAAWLAFGFAAFSIAFVVLGAILLDCGLRTAMVANQTLINAAVPESRARANSIFGIHVWGGNATGALLTSTAFAMSGWLAVCAICLTASMGVLSWVGLHHGIRLHDEKQTRYSTLLRQQPRLTNQPAQGFHLLA
jgi:MFS family permease